jgi:enoyl-CoA hydratase
MAYENIRVHREDPVAVVQLYRPKALNALNLALMEELVDALFALDRDDAVRCIVLTGDERAFAAGADIKEMADATAAHMVTLDQFRTWDRIRLVRKPLIAAVSGFALGGGCELMMMCDMVIAAENARFGQPEINLGVIPGAGGTQRLTRAVGKVVAMEMVLTGRLLTAQEALQFGLINRVVPNEMYLTEAKRLAQDIAAKAPVAVQLGKEAVNAAFDTHLTEGLIHERKNFYLLFATEDQKEGMAAFVEKRQPAWKGR